MNLYELSEKLMNKFKINIDYIIKCSDNTMEDLRNEAFIIVFNYYDKIKDNEKVFINELRNNCLKFNKYGKRIESKKRFEKFNNYENRMVELEENNYDLDENKICLLSDIQNIIGINNYNFLLEYYSMGCEYIANKYSISQDLARKRISNLLKKIRKGLDTGSE